MLFDIDMDYLLPYREQIKWQAISDALNSRHSMLYRKGTQRLWQTIVEHPGIKAQYKRYDLPQVTIGSAQEISQQQQQFIRTQLEYYITWRKGPFNIFGIEVDAEWRSDWKWSRLEPHIGSLQDKIVCDVGCNNGYYMFRMAQYKPKLVLGLDPINRYKLLFTYLQLFANEDNLKMELLGFEHLDLFTELFDVIFLLGIVYHHKSPIEVLNKCWAALKPNGLLVVDSMGIGSDQPIALFPGRRYAKAPGVWFLPSESCLINWLLRANFYQIRAVYNEPLSTKEQRRTAWTAVESLADFLDPDDSSITVEGFPRPRRIYMLAHKKPPNLPFSSRKA